MSDRDSARKEVIEERTKVEAALQKVAAVEKEKVKLEKTVK